MSRGSDGGAEKKKIEFPSGGTGNVWDKLGGCEEEERVVGQREGEKALGR